MKYILISLIAILALTLMFVPRAYAAEVSDDDLPSKENLHLFLLVGQSNMAGRGEVKDQDREIHGNILALNKDGKWEHAIDPIHFDKPIAGVGLARSFAMEYLKDHPGVTVGLVPAAHGGSPISTWMPGGYYNETRGYPYDDAIKRAKLAMEKGELKGILWHQGESDSHAGLAEKYKASLTEMIARFRTDLDAEGIPFIAGQLGKFEGGDWNEFTEQVDKATKEVAAEDEKVGYVSSDGLTSKPDNLHFSSASQREFGRRYYVVFKEIAGD